MDKVRAKSILIFLILSISMMMALSPLSAQTTWYVDNDALHGGDGSSGHPFRLIQDGINAASDGHTVIVRDGTYRNTGNRDLDFNGKAITLRSENGPENCIINCEGNEIEQHRGFYFHHDETEDSILEGFTIKNAYYDDRGGGIYCNEASPTIKNNIITTNWADLGGGISCYYADAKIINNTISLNTGDGAYGGIYCSFSSAIIRGNIIIENSGWLQGGGIGNLSGESEITHNIISGNTVGAPNSGTGGGIFGWDFDPIVYGNIITDNEAALGGGIGIYYASRCEIRNNFIAGNQGYRGGGIFYDDNVFPQIHDNIIMRNVSDGYGGGIYCEDALGTITNNAVIENSALYGGGILCRYSELTLTNNTIAGNTAVYEGGGFCCGRYSASTVTNTILWDNSASTGAEIYLDTAHKSTLSFSYSNVEGGLSESFIHPDFAVTWGPGMIDADPLFLRGPLGDYYLSQIAAGQPGESPCLDAGDAEIGRLPDIIWLGTTRTDMGEDAGIVDMGFHYPITAFPAKGK